MGVCRLLFQSCRYDSGLPMSAAAVSAAATTVEAATTTVEAATATNCAAAEAAADCAATSEARTATSESTSVKATTCESTTAVAGAKTTSAPAGASIESAAEPRAGSDEQAAGEVARTVVSVRCAGVGVIPVVSVGADRSWTYISRANAHAHCETLSISARC